MAFSFHSPPSMISYVTLLLVLILFTAPSSARSPTPTDFFGVVCSGTLNPPLCFKVIKLIPGAAKATSLESLAQIAITYTLSNGAETLNYLKSLENSATNPRLKEDYKSCSENYDDVLGNLQDAHSYLEKKDYFTVATRATSGMSAVSDCEDGFKTPPITDPSQLPAKNQQYYTLCLIILRIANKMSGRGPA